MKRAVKDAFIREGDVVFKPPFWTQPQRVTQLWYDGDAWYAEGEALDDAGPSWCPMQVCGDERLRIPHHEIQWIERNGVRVFDRSAPKEEGEPREEAE